MPRTEPTKPKVVLKDKGEKDETDNEIDPYDVESKSDCLRFSKKHAAIAYDNFRENAHPLMQWKSPKSGKTYDLCFAKYQFYDDFETLEWRWPRAWVGKECQIVLVGVWLNKNLVAINTFSPHGDETNFFYTEEMEEKDAWSLLEDGADTLEDVEISVSSGDEKVKSLNCPALETLK